MLPNKCRESERVKKIKDTLRCLIRESAAGNQRTGRLCSHFMKHSASYASRHLPCSLPLSIPSLCHMPFLHLGPPLKTQELRTLAILSQSSHLFRLALPRSQHNECLSNRPKVVASFSNYIESSIWLCSCRPLGSLTGHGRGSPSSMGGWPEAARRIWHKVPVPDVRVWRAGIPRLEATRPLQQLGTGHE